MRLHGQPTPPPGQYLGNRRRSVGCVASPLQHHACRRRDCSTDPRSRTNPRTAHRAAPKRRAAALTWQHAHRRLVHRGGLFIRRYVQPAILTRGRAHERARRRARARAPTTLSLELVTMRRRAHAREARRRTRATGRHRLHRTHVTSQQSSPTRVEDSGPHDRLASSGSGAIPNPCLWPSPSVESIRLLSAVIRELALAPRFRARHGRH